MESSMTPIKEEIFDKIDDNDLPDHLSKGRKIMESKPKAISINKDK